MPDAAPVPPTPPVAPPLGQPQQPPLGTAQPEQKQPEQKTPAQFSVEELRQKYGQTEQQLAAIHEKTGALQPPTLKLPPEPTPQGTNPAQVWGSAAMTLAIIGSLMTRQPLTTALNAAGNVMKAFKENDTETAQAEMERWKAASDTAFKTATFQLQAYDSALSHADKDANLALSQIQAYASAFNDKTALDVAQTQKVLGFAKLQNDRRELGIRAMEAQTKMAPLAAQLQMVNDLKGARAEQAAAKQSGNPQRIKDANDKVDQVIQSARDFQSVFAKAGAGGGGFGTGKVDKGALALVLAGMPLTQAQPGYRVSAADREALRDGAIKAIQQQTPGMTFNEAGLDLAQRQINYLAGRKATINLTDLQAQTTAARGQLDKNVGFALKELDALPSSDLSPVFNALMRGEERWTGDKRYGRFYFFLHGALFESAKIMSGGLRSASAISDSMAAEAKKWADENQTPSFIRGVLQGMGQEGEARNDSLNDALESVSLAKKHGVARWYKAGDVIYGPDGNQYTARTEGADPQFDMVQGGGYDSSAQE